MPSEAAPVDNDVTREIVVKSVERTSEIKTLLDNIKSIFESVRLIALAGAGAVSVIGGVGLWKIDGVAVELKELNDSRQFIELQAVALENVSKMQQMAATAAAANDASALRVLAAHVAALIEFSEPAMGRKELWDARNLAQAQYTALGNFLVEKCRVLPDCQGAREIREVRDQLPAANEALGATAAAELATETTQENSADIGSTAGTGVRAAPDRAERSTTIVNRRPVNPIGWDIDVFACASDRDRASAIAERLGAIADSGENVGVARQKLGRVRYRVMDAAMMQGLGISASTKVITVNANADEATTAEGVVSALAPLGLAPPPVISSTGTATPWYLSVFVCGGEA